MNNNVVISVENVVKSFKTVNGSVSVLKDVSFNINKNDFVVIGGANGSGKSVLMTIISGLEKASVGNVFVKEKIGLVFQDADSQILGETLIEDVCVSLKNIGYPKNIQKNRALECLDKVLLKDKAYCEARFLSGGEKRRLAVASIFALDANIIIFDEPYANLDWPGVIQVNNLLKNLKSSGKTIIILTHELEKVLGFANRFLVLYKGKLVFDSTPQNGLCENLEKWGIKNPICNYENLESLKWII